LAYFQVSNFWASTPQWGLGLAGPRGFLGGFPAGLGSFQALNGLRKKNMVVGHHVWPPKYDDIYCTGKS